MSNAPVDVSEERRGESEESIAPRHRNVLDCSKVFDVTIHRRHQRFPFLAIQPSECRTLRYATPGLPNFTSSQMNEYESRRFPV